MANHVRGCFCDDPAHVCREADDSHIGVGGLAVDLGMPIQPAPTPEAVERVARFLDATVRGWLPSDHFHCDSSCPHGASQREMYDLLDAEVAALRREA